MTTTIVGIYDEFQPAFSAKNELLAKGFSWTHVSLNPDHEIPPRERSAVPKPDHSSVMEAMVKGLFDLDANSARGNVYAEAVRRGGYVVTADVDTPEQHALAEQIMQHFHPVHVEQRPAIGSSAGVGATPGLTGM